MTTKVITCLLLFMFAFDALAIWDVVELFASGVHSQLTESKTNAETHFHNPQQTEHQPQPPDSCTLCACCVSGVNMLASYFTFDSNISLLTILTLQKPQAVSWSAGHIFHPPKSFS